MFNEEILEKISMELLYHLGYECMNGYELHRTDFSEILLEEDFIQALEKINKGIKKEEIQETLRRIRHLDHNNTIYNNKQLTKYLLNGVSIPVQENGEIKYKTIQILDFKNIENNTFKAINEYTIIEHSKIRPDILLFVNGLPFVMIELKSTIREDIKSIEAFNQLKAYQEVHIPSLFYYNQFIIVSDGIQAKVGTITSSWNSFSEWKKVEDTDEVKPNMPTHQSLFNGMLRKDRLLDLIHHFILWSDDNKILSAYHQYFGVKKAIISTENAIRDKTRRAGLLWHTQGSGKNLSMVFYTRNMIQRLKDPYIIVVTDRNDLEQQLFFTFFKCSDYLEQEPIQIENREDLKEKLDDRKLGGIFFTTLQKFERETGLLSQRDDILVIVDEAHRSHYGLDEMIQFNKEKRQAYKKSGTARYLHQAFPNATYIGFTGTPVGIKEKSTSNVFGNIIDTYDMTQAILDHATLPITYQSRIARVELNEKLRADIDNYYQSLETEENIEDDKIAESILTVAQIIEEPNRLEMIVKDIINHYEQIQDSVANKAMVIAYSRKSAYRMYKKFLELRPDWKNKVKIILTSSSQDDEEMQKTIGSKIDKKQLEIEFKDMNSEFKIAIVVNMWLTGFDLPGLGTLYIDKPMKDHNLMQAIARVNRVYQDKTSGLIIDYIGLKPWLFDALNTYTKRDEEKIMDHSKLVKVFMDNVELVRNLFYGFTYLPFATTTNNQKYEMILAGSNWILKTEETKKAFMKYSYDIKSLYFLCIETLSQEIKDEILFFLAVRSFILKLSGKKMDLKEINKNAAELLEKAIQNDKMLQLGQFHNLSLLSDEFLNELTNRQNKCISVEILNNILKQYIEQIGNKNIVLLEKYSVKFEKILAAYYKRTSVTDVEKIMKEMIYLKNEMNQNLKAGNEYDLSSEEKAFWNAIRR